MKKVLVSLTTLFFLLLLGSVSVFADPGEPIGTTVQEDHKEKKVKDSKKEKDIIEDDTTKLDPGEPTGT